MENRKDKKDKLLIEIYDLLQDISWKCIELEAKILRENKVVYDYQRRLEEEATY